MSGSESRGRWVREVARGLPGVGAARGAVRRVTLGAAVVLAASAAGCATGRGAAAPGLPPIPRVTGPLALRVAYPDSLARIAVRDSNFLFGSTGSGDVELTIDGTPVPVEPNGAFLAWLPVPASAAGDTARYELVAHRGTSVDTLVWPVLLPREPFRGVGPAWIDTTTLVGTSERWARPDEEVRLAVRGAPGAEVRLTVGERGYRLREVTPGRYELRLLAGELYGDARPVLRASPVDTVTAAASEPPGTPGEGRRIGSAPLDTIGWKVELAAGGDTARAAGSLPLRLVDPRSPPVFELAEPPDTVNGPAEVVVGRPLPEGPYMWRFPDRTVAAVDGRVGDRLRVRLGPDLEAWVDTSDARPLPDGTPPPRVRVGDVRIVHRPEGLRIDLSLGSRVPLRVRARGRTLRLTLYDARGGTDRLMYGPEDSMLVSAGWEQLPGRRWRLELALARPVWGWRATWIGGGDAAPASGTGTTAPGSDALVPGGSVPPGASDPADETDRARPVDTSGTLRLEVRRPPHIDPGHPLRGRVIAVDPGHPPAGAHGPTGFYEGDANLAVARHLAALLREAGAVPVLVRTDTLPLGLYERARRAERAGAELFVSIHNNALPDGVRPFGQEGTSTYYYHANSRELAGDVQQGLLRTMGLRDLGVGWGDLAVARQTWMPAVLAEGAFMMMPRQEAALRTTGFEEAYARGVLRGIREFLESRAGS